jgi:DNA-binding transcriptional ArsR family regulator
VEQKAVSVDEMAFDFKNLDIERLQIAAHPTRLRILHSLHDKGSYAAKLGQELHIERKVVAFHLAELEKVELVEAKYALNQDKRPVAVKFYKITPKGKYIYQHVVDIVSKR